MTDPAELPVAHVAVYEYPSDYEDNEPLVRVGATRVDALRALASEVQKFLDQISFEDAGLANALAEAGALTPDMDALALAQWLSIATGNGGAVTITTEPVHGRKEPDMQIEVWSLLVISPDGPPAVTVHANEDECMEVFRENYDPEGEGQDLDFTELTDSLNVRFEIDVHLVTNPKIKENA